MGWAQGPVRLLNTSGPCRQWGNLLTVGSPDGGAGILGLLCVSSDPPPSVDAHLPVCAVRQVYLRSRWPGCDCGSMFTNKVNLSSVMCKIPTYLTGWSRDSDGMILWENLAWCLVLERCLKMSVHPSQLGFLGVVFSQRHRNRNAHNTQVKDIHNSCDVG